MDMLGLGHTRDNIEPGQPHNVVPKKISVMTSRRRRKGREGTILGEMEFSGGRDIWADEHHPLQVNNMGRGKRRQLRWISGGVAGLINDPKVGC